MQVHFHASYVTYNYICPGIINLYPFACFLAIADNNTKLVDKGYLFNLTVHLEMLLSPHLLAVISLLLFLGTLWKSSTWVLGWDTKLPLNAQGDNATRYAIISAAHTQHTFIRVQGTKTFQVNWNNFAGNIVQFGSVWAITPSQPLSFVSPGSLLHNTEGILAMPCTSIIFPARKTVSPL